MGGENLTYQRKVVQGTHEVKKMTPKSKRKSQTKPQKQRKRGEITQRKQTMHQCRN
jgi:hypothetical protein